MLEKQESEQSNGALFTSQRVRAKQLGRLINKGESESVATDSRFASRLCEFFVIDMNENFYIWNLNKNIHKSIHKIDFVDKHGGVDEGSLMN
jgi:hypothetical protein